MPDKKIVIITVRGGVAEVYSNPKDVDVMIWDYDESNIPVILMADVYHWNCPVCGTQNLEAEPSSGLVTVTCKMCNVDFSTVFQAPGTE